MREFERIITDMTELFRQFAGIEQVKLKAASGNHIATVEECMTKEQALILKLRGLEQERENWQQKAGYGGKSFRQILDAAPPQDRERLSPLFEEFGRQLGTFREVNEDANMVMSNNLRMIQNALNAKEGNVYSSNGQNDAKVTHMTSRKA